jgi:hypothetical protein
LLDAVKASINANLANFTDFNSVKEGCVEFKHTQAPTNYPKTQQVAFVSCGGRGGGSRSHQSGRGQWTGNAWHKGLVLQAEIDKQTHIQLKDYSADEYKQPTPVKKAKLWQLRNSGMTLGTSDQT